MDQPTEMRRLVTSPITTRRLAGCAIFNVPTLASFAFQPPVNQSVSSHFLKRRKGPSFFLPFQLSLPPTCKSHTSSSNAGSRCSYIVRLVRSNRPCTTLSASRFLGFSFGCFLDSPPWLRNTATAQDGHRRTPTSRSQIPALPWECHDWICSTGTLQDTHRGQMVVCADYLPCLC